MAQSNSTPTYDGERGPGNARAGARTSMARMDVFDLNQASIPNEMTTTSIYTVNGTHKIRRSDYDRKQSAWTVEDVASEASEEGKDWKDMTSKEKVIRVLIGIGKVVAVLILLYFFVCSLDCLSLGFRLVGGRRAGELFRQSDLLKNPIVGVMIGILTTVLVQSSSTSTSIIVSMVAADFLDVEMAIPIVMGANIGTSITNTIVSLTQAGDRQQFRRAFAGATVHDMFNWLTVIILLIVEVTTHYLLRVTTLIKNSIADQASGGGEIATLTVITDPLVETIVQLDKNVLECWSSKDCEWGDEVSLLKKNCGPEETVGPVTIPPEHECTFLFAQFGLNDAISGAILLLLSLFVLCGCLILIVKVLQSVMRGQMALVIRKTLNAKIPYVPWITGYLAILVGAVMTFLVQSSSVFTSALTPLVGLGVISVERVYPLTLGSNIGTTTTALLAALAVKGDKFAPSLQIALCHLLFNISGILLFYPIPFMRFPIGIAKFLGETTAKYRWFAIAYMVVMFLILPAVIMALSFAGPIPVIVFCLIIVIPGAFILTVNMLRQKKPEWLPEGLKSWKWLPTPLRSLEPYDRFFTRWACCRKLRDKAIDNDEPPADYDNPAFDVESTCNTSSSRNRFPNSSNRIANNLSLGYIDSQDTNNQNGYTKSKQGNLNPAFTSNNEEL